MEENIQVREISDILKDNSLIFGNYVILNRALPDIRDGNKPVVRKLLVAMHDDNAYTNVKCASITGLMMKKYHPHGSCYNVIVNQIHTDGVLTPYIIGKGSFSHHYSKAKASNERYTEARLSPFAKHVLNDLKLKTVDYVDNFDGTLKIPEVLPVQFPSILHCSQEGIAYGMANKMPSFNLVELNNATVKFIETGEKTLLVPDFASGGLIIKNDRAFNQINYISGTDEEKKSNKTASLYSVKLRAKVDIEENVMYVREIPYETTIDDIFDKIRDLYKQGKLKEITDIVNMQGHNTFGIKITCKKNTDMDLLLEKLYALTPLECGFSCNMNIINLKGLPQVMSVWDIIEEWLVWRRSCVVRGVNNTIATKEKKLHFLKGLEKVVLDIEKTIDIIRNSETDAKINENLMKHFNLDETQAEEIANMKLRRINKGNIIKQIKDIEELENEINTLKNNVKDENYINQLVIDGLNEISQKFGQSRRTQIIEINETIKDKISQIKNEVESYNVRVVCTSEGYVKKLSLKAKAEQKLKDGDKIMAEFITNNTQELLVFSGTDCYKVQLDDLADSNSNALGEYLPTKLEIDTPIGYSVVDGGYKYLAILYNTSKIAKVDLSAFETATKRKKLSNSLHKDSNVVKMITLKGDEQLVLINEKGKEFTIDSNDLNAVTSRSSQGSFPKSKKNIIDFKVLETEE